jgi:hypothetical protein
VNIILAISNFVDNIFFITNPKLFLRECVGGGGPGQVGYIFEDKMAFIDIAHVI